MLGFNKGQGKGKVAFECEIIIIVKCQNLKGLGSDFFDMDMIYLEETNLS